MTPEHRSDTEVLNVLVIPRSERPHMPLALVRGDSNTYGEPVDRSPCLHVHAALCPPRPVTGVLLGHRVTLLDPGPGHALAAGPSARKTLMRSRVRGKMAA